MMWRDDVVTGTRMAWGPAGRSCAELDVKIVGAPNGAGDLLPDQRIRAVVYEVLIGLPGAAERVRPEASTLDRAPGIGGRAMVSFRLDVLPPDPPREGHLIKACYMPDQVMVTGVDEQGMAHHGPLSQPIDSLDLEGMPVVVADLHSSLPAVLAGLRSPDGQEQPRVAYIMADGGALPLAYSRVVAVLDQAGWLAGTITAGQAWGGDIEAVSIHNALLAARHVLHANAAVIIQGPGNLGTETSWGFSGMACGDAINAIATLGGHPVARPRVSQAGTRARHRGVSHHSMTAYGRIALAGADVVVPDLKGPLGMQVHRETETPCAPRPGAGQHRLVEVPADGLLELLWAVEAQTEVRLSTVRRGLDEGVTAFIAAVAAGRHTRQILDEGAAHD